MAALKFCCKLFTPLSTRRCLSFPKILFRRNVLSDLLSKKKVVKLLCSWEVKQNNSAIDECVSRYENNKKHYEKSESSSSLRYFYLASLVIGSIFNSSNVAYATGDDDREKENSFACGPRHKGSFMSRRRQSALKKLANASANANLKRHIEKENNPEEKDTEPAEKRMTRTLKQPAETYFQPLGTRLIDLSVLIKDLNYCSQCHAGPLSLATMIEEKQSGLSSIFIVKCSSCDHRNEVKSSGEHRAGSRGPLVSNINTRAALGSLHGGIGHTHLSNLLSTMNVPTMNHVLFRKREREIGTAAEKVARESCKVNLGLEKTMTEQSSGTPADGLVAIAVSYDMGWQKRGRGHNSLTGHGACYWKGGQLHEGSYRLFLSGNSQNSTNSPTP